MRTLNYTYSIGSNNKVTILYDYNGANVPPIVAYEFDDEFATRQDAENWAQQFIAEIVASGPARNQVPD